MPRWLVPTALAVLAVLVVAACGAPADRPARTTSGAGPSGGASSGADPSGPPTPAATRSTTPAPPPDRAGQVLAGLSLPQRVGQLLMIGLPAAGSATATLAAVRDQAVGTVFLSGRDRAGVGSVTAVTAAVQAAATAVPLLVGTDQEGGEVQVLSGPGFDTMPTGVQQGAMPPAALQSAAVRWGGQLAAGGVHVDLGPVLDTVPPGTAGAANPPIAGYDRQLGDDPADVSAHALAVFHGLAAAGVVATGKHFPGLGRVTANTDTHAGVSDPATGVDDAYLQPFADAIHAGMAMIMISLATYPQLDPTQPAVFSPAIVTGLLRQRLGFAGVVVSDDLGNAASVRDVPLGQRAVRFVAAGGDLVLDVDPADAATLAAALVAAAQASPTFAAQVDAAALRVLRLKASLGLLG